MLIIRQHEVAEALAGREAELIALVGDAYRRHDRGESRVPHSVFLRFPDNQADRIIALPAYLNGRNPVAGMKWISSFPGNLGRRLPRASGAIILNSLATGAPEAFMEASTISAARTGASAALAASVLAGGASGITLVGCGVINFEVLRLAAVALPALSTATLFDVDSERAAAFARRVAHTLPGVTARTVADRGVALAAHDLISVATTAVHPHLDRADFPPGSTVLHISLRDLTPEAILACHNVVDDADHVCREQTSLHLAEQRRGDRGFIDASIGALLAGVAALPSDPQGTVVFSPFGLGILDVALARFVFDRVTARGGGVNVPDFAPLPAGEPAPVATT
jgi:2,3-diaminopropionate biosynthesis protein SbnB